MKGRHSNIESITKEKLVAIALLVCLLGMMIGVKGVKVAPSGTGTYNVTALGGVKVRKKEVKEMLVNFTNHPSDRWGEKQRIAAMQYGEVVDIPFPAVDAEGDEHYIQKLAGEYVGGIQKRNPSAVLCQGEFCLAYQVATLLKQGGITVLAACSERIVKEEENVKKAVFEFCRFREY